jgi:ribulose-phosphate 3-epimerase
MNAYEGKIIMNIYPSLMIVPAQELEKEIQLLAPYCAGFHIDIMDGIFVSNVFWYDPAQINKVVKLAKRVWIHLMIQKPDDFYQQLDLPVGSLVSFHLESNIDVFGFAKTIREKKHRVSLAINPKTPISDIVSFLNVIDHALIMSVDPGRAGQSFLENSFEKIAELITYREKHTLHFSMGIDGGVNKNNINRLAKLDVNDCAVATDIFNDEDHMQALLELQRMSEQ